MASEPIEQANDETPPVKTGFWRNLFFGAEPGVEPFEWPSWGCKHKWTVVDKTVLESAYEQMSASGYMPASTPPVHYFRKKVVILLQCSECGKLVKHWDAINPSHG